MCARKNFMLPLELLKVPVFAGQTYVTYFLGTSVGCSQRGTHLHFKCIGYTHVLALQSSIVMIWSFANASLPKFSMKHLHKNLRRFTTVCLFSFLVINYVTFSVNNNLQGFLTKKTGNT